MGPCCLILEEVAAAGKGIKMGKAADPTDVVGGMITGSGGFGTRWMIDLITTLSKKAVFPIIVKRVSWCMYTRKCDSHVCGSYRAIKLVEQPMKVLEKVLEKRIRCHVN